MKPVARKTVRLSELRSLPPDQFTERVNEIARARHEPLNGEVSDLGERIAELEQRYEMSSETMCRLFNEQKLRETADICSWRMLLSLKNRLVQPTR